MMKLPSWIVISVLMAALALSACGPAPTPDLFIPPDDLVATQVAILLTASPPAPIDSETAVIETAPPPAVTATPQVELEPTPTDPPPTETPTPDPTITNTPQPEPTLTPTLAVGDPRVELGAPSFQDKTFEVGKNWGTPWTGDFTEGRFENNRLMLKSVGPDGWTVTWPRPENFYLEMTASTVQCTGRDRYGLVVRVPDPPDRGYLFGITCDGRYSLRMWDPDTTRYQILVNWTESPHINAGSNQTNRVGLKVEGDRFGMYVNGHFLGEAFDDTLEDGRFGPYIGHEVEGFTIAVSEFAYWKLP
jgi:hypothetical protein